MPKIVSRRSRKHHKVVQNGIRLPAISATATAGMQGFYTIPMTPQPASNSLGSGNTLYFDLERDECGEINDLCLRLRVKCSNGNVTATPPYYWFKRIVIESEKGSGDELVHIYPEQMVLWNWLLQEEEGRDKWAKLSNFANVKLKGSNMEKFYDSEKTKFVQNEIKEIYLQLPAGFLHMDAIDMKHIRSDLRIRMELSSDIIIDGDVSNLSLDDVSLLINSFREESYDDYEKKQNQKNYKNGYVYLDAERLQINDKTLNAGQKTKFALDQFVGKAAFLAVFVKPSASPSASNRSLYNYVNLGDDTEFDVTNSSSQSLFGNGTAIKQPQLLEMFETMTGNQPLKGVYVIPFCEDIKKSFTCMNGIFDFYGLRDYLEITFDSAPTQEVQTINTESLGVTGSYRYAFEKGIISDQEVSFDETAANIESAINAIPQLVERDISVTVNDGLDAVTAQTVTFNANSGPVVDELGKITVLGNGIPRVTSTSLTTKGTTGFTSGSDYQVEIFMYKYKLLTVDKKGNVNCKDL